MNKLTRAERTSGAVAVSGYTRGAGGRVYFFPRYPQNKLKGLLDIVGLLGLKPKDLTKSPNGEKESPLTI
jgi:hypothetical protein